MNQLSILITGGTGKIGGALTRHFVQKGHSVFVPTRTPNARPEICLKLGLDPASVYPVFLESDLSAANSVDLLVAKLEEIGERHWTVIHAARNLETLRIGEKGISDPGLILEEFRMAVAVPYEIAMKLGSLQNMVIISSMYGVVAPSPGLYDDFEGSSPIQYGLAKASQIHLARELAVRLAPRKVRVNCVSPGGVEGRVDDAFRARYASLNPLGRMLNEIDVVGPVDFLVSDASAGMTGHNLIVDGGWSVW